MKIDKYGKWYCINNLVAMVVETIRYDKPDLTSDEILDKFTKSKTYQLLCDIKTGLWTEGPDYIIDMYQKETENFI